MEWPRLLSVGTVECATLPPPPWPVLVQKTRLISPRQFFLQLGYLDDKGGRGNTLLVGRSATAAPCSSLVAVRHPANKQAAAK